MRYTIIAINMVVFALQCVGAHALTDAERLFRSIKLGMSSTQISHLIKRPVQNFCNQSNGLISVTNNVGKFDFRTNSTGHITHKSLLYNSNNNVRYDKPFKYLAEKYDCDTNNVLKVEYAGYVVGFVPLSSITMINSNLEETQNEKGLDLHLIPRDKKGFHYFAFCKIQSEPLVISGSELCEKSKLFCPVYHPSWSGARF